MTTGISVVEYSLQNNAFVALIYVQ